MSDRLQQGFARLQAGRPLEALEIARAISDRVGVGGILNNLGTAHLAAGDPAAARDVATCAGPGPE